MNNIEIVISGPFGFFLALFASLAFWAMYRETKKSTLRIEEMTKEAMEDIRSHFDGEVTFEEEIIIEEGSRSDEQP